MQLAARMHHERAWHDVDRLGGRAHDAAAGEAEIDLGRERMAVIGADLPRLPARHGDVALADHAEDFLDMMLGIPLLLLVEIEHVHGLSSELPSRHPSRRAFASSAASSMVMKTAPSAASFATKSPSASMRYPRPIT